jgi:hypothetical protein
VRVRADAGQAPGQFQVGSGLGTGRQVPIVPESRQELHGPAQAVAQQTPCWQKPLAHSSLLVQVHSGSRRHEPFRQW